MEKQAKIIPILMRAMNCRLDEEPRTVGKQLRGEEHASSLATSSGTPPYPQKWISEKRRTVRQMLCGMSLRIPDLTIELDEGRDFDYGTTQAAIPDGSRRGVLVRTLDK